MTKVNLENIGKILVPEQPRTDSTCYGRVDSINDDGSFQVQLNASATKTRCANLCGAAVNDRVLVLIQANGHCAAIGRVGGSMGAIPAVLYDNPSGYNGNITLEESAADYDYIRVYFFVSREGTVTYASTDVYEPNGKTVSLFGVRNAAYNSRFHYGGATYSISNSTMTLVSSGVADSSGSTAGDWNTYIYRVEAWSGGASIGFGGGSGGGGDGGVPVTDVLYNNDTGGSGTITLSKSVAQYDHIRIYFGYETYARSSVDVYNPNGKQVNLFMQQSYDGQYQTIQSANVVPNGNTITMGSPAKFDVNFNDGALFQFAQANNLRIYRVEAWNGTYTSATEATCTLDTTYASTGRSTVKVSKNGGVCTITFMPLILKAQSGRNTFGTVPEGFRPVGGEYYVHPNGWANEYYLIVGTDGTLKAHITLPSENESWASGTYVIGG